MSNTKDLIKVVEAVCIRDGLTLLIQKISAQSDHESDVYKAQMQFLTYLYKKYQRIADKRVSQDTAGNYHVIEERDLRKDFNNN